MPRKRKEPVFYDYTPVGGKTAREWEEEWTEVEGGFGPHPPLRYVVGLFRAVKGGQVMFVGQATEHKNRGLYKRLADFRRNSPSGREHHAGKRIREHLNSLTLEVLVTGSDKEAAQVARTLRTVVLRHRRPPWNVPNAGPKKRPPRAPLNPIPYPKTLGALSHEWAAQRRAKRSILCEARGASSPQRESPNSEAKMLLIQSEEALSRALRSDLDHRTKALLRLRARQLTKDAPDEDLADLAHFAVVQPGDTPADLERAIGFYVFRTRPTEAASATPTGARLGMDRRSRLRLRALLHHRRQRLRPRRDRPEGARHRPSLLNLCAYSCARGRVKRSEPEKTTQPPPSSGFQALAHPTSGLSHSQERSRYDQSLRPGIGGRRPRRALDPQLPAPRRPRPTRSRDGPHPHDALPVVEPGDSEDDIVDDIGMSPLTSPLDGARYGSPSFQPWWDYLEFHPGDPGWFEMVICVGNSGWAAIVLIQDADGVIPQMVELCRRFTSMKLAEVPSEETPS